jgi:hypothetical protein
LFYICEKAEIKDIKLQKTRKVLMTAVLLGGLFKKKQGCQFFSASVLSRPWMSEQSFVSVPSFHKAAYEN